MLTDFLAMLARRGSGFRWVLVGFGIGLHAIDASGWLAILGGCNVRGWFCPSRECLRLCTFLFFMVASGGYWFYLSWGNEFVGKTINWDP
jgi:hypothetical protein